MSWVKEKVSGFCPGRVRSKLMAYSYALDLRLLTILLAALSRRDRRAVRTGARMSQEGADLLRRLGGENVLELARLLLDLSFVGDAEGLYEKPLRQPVPADHVFCAAASTLGEFQRRMAMLGAHGAI